MRHMIGIGIIGWLTVGAGQVRADDGKRGDDAALRTYLSANGMLNRGLYELAAAEYRKFLGENADHEKKPLARYGLGVCLFRMGQTEQSVKELQPLAGQANFEFAAEVSTILGQCHLAAKRFAEAAESFRSAVRSHPDHALADDAWAGRVEALYLDQKFAEAGTEGEAFIRRWPDSPLRERVAFFTGLAYYARKDHAAASQAFESLLERYPKSAFAGQASLLLAQAYRNEGSAEKAVRQYRHAIQQADADRAPEAIWGLATILVERGERVEAARWFDQLVEKHPQSELIPAARLQRGRIWFEEQQFDRALESFEQVAEGAGPWQDHAAYWAAKCRMRQGEPADAARRLTEASERFPQSTLLAEMLYDAGVAYARSGDVGRTVTSLEAFGVRFPDHPLAVDAQHLLAVTEHQRGQYPKSDEHCRSFVARFPGHPKTAEVRFLSAENDFLAGNYEPAAQKYVDFLRAFPDDGQALKARFRLGSALFRLEKYDEAVAYLSTTAAAADREPTFRPALMALGDISFHRSEWKKAEEYLAGYVAGPSEMPAMDDALLKLGIARQRQNRHPEALVALDRLIEKFPDSPHRVQATFERGQSLVAMERWDDAVSAFQETLSAGDARFAPYALNHLASIASRRGDFAKAADLLEKAAQRDCGEDLTAGATLQRGMMLMADHRFTEAEAAFTKFLSRYASHPRAAEARTQRAIALSRQNKHQQAIDGMAEIKPTDLADIDPGLRAAVGYEKAWCLRELGRNEDAAKAYRELLEASAGGELPLRAQLELAGLESNAKRWSEAASILRSLRGELRTAPAADADLKEQVTYRLALCESELGNTKEAVELFAEFLGGFPESPLVASASYQAGEALLKLGRYEESAKAFTRVTDRFPDDPLTGPALLRLGDCLASAQRWPASERAFSDYLERFPSAEPWFQAQFGIGWAREHQQRYAEAIDAYQTVVARHKGPTAARAQFQIGECLFAQEKFEDAARELLKVDILYAYAEWSAPALYEAGRCFERLGKGGDARTQFSQVLDQHGGTRWAELASQRLAELSSAAIPPGHSR